MFTLGIHGKVLGSFNAGHVAQVKAGRMYDLVFCQDEGVMLGLHWHRARSVLCVGEADGCPVCFTEGLSARFYFFALVAEVVKCGGSEQIGRKAVIQLPYSGYGQLMRGLADLGDSASLKNLRVNLWRQKGLRSPVLVKVLSRSDLLHGIGFKEEILGTILRWLRLPQFNGDRDAWTRRVCTIVAGDDYYAGGWRP